MPVSFAIRFPAGRFHATPWGHHVNEGLPEWPPSPWRLLRALVATWKRKLAGESLVETHLPIVLAELARRKPEFQLPPATLGHTRHFMPLKFPDRGDRTKVFDAFVALSPDSEIVVHWPEATLAQDRLQVLDLVLSRLGYLGRAESWSAARLLSEFYPGRVNCRPGPAEAGQESVRVLTTDPNKWSAWDFKDKKIPKPDPLWNLLAETADMHQEKWSDPPGSKWVTYSRPSDCFAPKPRVQQHVLVKPSGFTTARFALDAPVLPLVTDTLPVAEAVRTALMGSYQRLLHQRKYGQADKPYRELFRSPTLAGKDEAGQPLRDHRHARYLPVDEDSDGRLDHVVVFAEAGFDADELSALDRLRSLHVGHLELRLLRVGIGQPEDFRGPLFGPARTWVSATPFVVTRYPKRRGAKRDLPEHYATPSAFTAHVLREELDRLRLPTVEHIDLLEGIGPRRLRAIQFRRFRAKPDDDGGRRPAAGFRVRFAHPAQGPLCLGHSGHFGLGLFVAEN